MVEFSKDIGLPVLRMVVVPMLSYALRTVSFSFVDTSLASLSVDKILKIVFATETSFRTCSSSLKHLAIPRTYEVLRSIRNFSFP